MTLILKKIPVVWILTLSLSLEKKIVVEILTLSLKQKQIPVAGILSLKEKNPCGEDFDFEFERKKSM